MNDFDPEFSAALDRFSVPALPTGFAAQIVRTATNRPLPPRRDPRGGWRRNGWLLIGVGTLVLASATGTAAGIFGRLPVRLPDLTRVFAPAAPVAFTTAQTVRHATRTAPKPAALGLEILAAPDVAPAAQDPANRHEIIRERLLAIRDARIAAGAPTRPLRQRASPDQIAHRKAFVADHPMLAARLVEQLRARFRDRVAAELRAGRTLRGRQVVEPAAMLNAAMQNSVKAGEQPAPQSDEKLATPQF